MRWSRLWKTTPTLQTHVYIFSVAKSMSSFNGNFHDNFLFKTATIFLKKLFGKQGDLQMTATFITFIKLRIWLGAVKGFLDSMFWFLLPVIRKLYSNKGAYESQLACMAMNKKVKTQAIFLDSFTHSWFYCPGNTNDSKIKQDILQLRSIGHSFQRSSWSLWWNSAFK